MPVSKTKEIFGVAAQAVLVFENPPVPAGFLYHAPHANRPTPPRKHKGRKWWRAMSLFKNDGSRMNKRRFRV